MFSRGTVDELIRVLAYPKFRLTRDEIDAVLAAYLPFCETVGEPIAASDSLPQCSDSEDQKFLELAVSGGAEMLVTGDRDLLRLNSQVSFSIASPAELRRSTGR